MINALRISLSDLLKREGATIVADIRGQLPVARGDLKDSVEAKVSQEGSIHRLQILAAPHFRFVELGRKKGGKMPPLDAIRKWCEIKGIPVRAAFPIARAIQRNGIRPKHILKFVLPRATEALSFKVRNIFRDAIKVEGINLVKRVFSKVG